MAETCTVACDPQRTIKSPDAMAHCPSCLATLPREPKRRIDCPACGEPVLVRAAQGFVSASLVTVEEAAMLDLLKKTVGLPGHDELVGVVRNAWGPRGAVSQAVTRWGLALPDEEAHTLCYAIALALCQAGLEHVPMLRRAHEPELRRMADGGVTRVQVLSIGGCEACAALHEKVFPIAQALRHPPIPHPECGYDAFGPQGFCRCTYTPIL